MGRLKVSVERDHLERLVHSPRQGIAELIWNALDADAKKVDVAVEVNAWDGAETLTVSDDGKGITPERAEADFGHLGGSWKRSATATDDGRMLHGRNGQGRWSAYGLGELVHWESVADRVTGDRTRIGIRGRRAQLDEFDVSEPEVVPDVTLTGTVVTVEQLNEPAQKALLADGVADWLTTVFAIYLEQYPVVVAWRGKKLDPKAMQINRTAIPLTIEGVEGSIELTIVEWSRPAERALHLCGATGTSLAWIPPNIKAPGFQFTAYVRWDGFNALQHHIVLGEMGDEPLPTIIEAARDELRRHFLRRSSERGSALVQAWKEDKTYPYESPPSTTLERAERDLFEILAVSAAPIVEPADKRSRELTLRLLKTAIESSPGTVHEVLQEVLHLPDEQMAELSQLLKHSTLSAIISAARQITNRLDFLAGLEQIIFDAEIRKHVLERSQLHRILANETWVFREEYALTADDVSLRTALRSHIALLGREDLAPEEVDAADVLDEHGARVVVDMMLSRVIEQHRNLREHIVIELKRPTVHVGQEQLGQIMKYATAVVSDSRFAGTNVHWEFWIVGDSIDESVLLQTAQANRAPGIFVDNPDKNLVVRVVTWSQIIQDARHRLSFVKAALNHSGDGDRGLDYLRRTHGKYLPRILTSTPEGVDESTPAT
jgi:Histidine kinase-, DNA gyrase B-, and HSP90-like ATPase